MIINIRRVLYKNTYNVSADLRLSECLSIQPNNVEATCQEIRIAPRSELNWQKVISPGKLLRKFY